MARYRKIDVRVWNDKKFSDFPDDGKLAFLFLLTHPNLTSLGAMRATKAGLAEELGWAGPKFGRVFDSLVTADMVRFDARASFLWLPNFLRYNAPENPNVVRGWAKSLDLLPECALRDRVLHASYLSLARIGKGLPEAFREVFGEGFGKGLPEPPPKGSPKQEQRTDNQDLLDDDDHVGGSWAAGGDVVSSTATNANRGGTEQLAVMELVAIWNRTRTTANSVAMPMGAKAYRALVDAVRLRSLDAWEATFRRVEASDYLAGRTDLPGLTLWDAIDRAEVIDGGRYDNRKATPKATAEPDLSWAAEVFADEIAARARGAS